MRKSLPFFLIIFFICCDKNNELRNRTHIIPPDSMVMHIVGISLFEAAHGIPFSHPDSVKLKFCPVNPQLCSRARFDSSLKYYCFHTQTLKDIIRKSIDSLQKYKNQKIK
ncbi:MAG: DUF4296 domain-containing protein [Bacteroidia bacterium]|nr:DUF4296 domain-containing protein [Bacteroidia bacterium]